MTNYALYFTGKNSVEVRDEKMTGPLEGEVLVKASVSGISSGTELLYYRGLVPENMMSDMSIPELKKNDRYPMKYGYSSVGNIVETGPGVTPVLIGRRVFAFFPHQRYFCSETSRLSFIPEDIADDDAVFLPNAETALNLMMDGRPVIGEKTAVLGLGVVGLLAASMLMMFPVDVIAGFDRHERRRNMICAPGVFYPCDPAGFSANCGESDSFDLVFELSGNPDALGLAIELACYDGRIVVGSWYGKKECRTDLGGKFHRSRLKIVSSQVSTIAPEFSGRFDAVRRMRTAWNMIRSIRPSRFITHRYGVTESPSAYRMLAADAGDAIQVVIDYGGVD